MKNILVPVILSVFSSMGTIVTYKYFFEEKPTPVRDVIIRAPKHVHQVNGPTNSTPFRSPNLSPKESFTMAAQLARPAVVHIHSNQGSGYEDFFGSSSSGSGVIVSEDGYIVTNHHVVSDAKELTVVLNNKRSYTARLIGADKSTDIAVIKISKKELKNRKLKVLTFGNSDNKNVGEWVLAVGNPFNLTSTVTAGIISAKGRNIDILEDSYSIESFIQTDAAVNPGNSGGALIDTKGELIGINTAIITRSGRYEGYSFAVPSNLVHKIMLDIIEFGKVQRGFMGVKIRDLDDAIASEYKLKDLYGVYIDNVTSSGAANKAGLKKGDVILKLNDKNVKSSPELQEQVGLYRPGDKITILFLREGKLKETEVELLNSADSPTLSKGSIKKDLSDMTTLLPNMGIDAKNIDKSIAKRFKTTGVIINKINDNSILKATNMQVSFIVTTVNGDEVYNLKAFKQAIVDAQGKVVLGGFYEEYPGKYSYAFDK